MDIVKSAAENYGSSEYTQVENTTSSVDKDMFLQLLVTQMKYQDPLSPVDNNEFISQTTQFTLLEEIQKLGETFSQNKAFQLIGKEVAATLTDSVTNQVEAVTGTVKGVIISDGNAILDMGDYQIDPDDVFFVSEPESVVETVVEAAEELIESVGMEDVMGEENGEQYIEEQSDELLENESAAESESTGQ